MLLNLLIILSDLLSLLLTQGNDIVNRHFEAVGILVIEDRRFFDRLCHNSFLLFFSHTCKIDAGNNAKVTKIFQNNAKEKSIPVSCFFIASFEIKQVTCVWGTLYHKLPVKMQQPRRELHLFFRYGNQYENLDYISKFCHVVGYGIGARL